LNQITNQINISNLDAVIKSLGALDINNDNFVYKCFDSKKNIEFGVFGERKEPCIGININKDFKYYKSNTKFKIIEIFNAPATNGQKLLIILKDQNKIEIFKKLYVWIHQDISIDQKLFMSFEGLSEYIEQYSKLFEKKITNKISEESLLGLFGELDLLKELLKSKKYTTTELINSWAGYYRSRHDFKFPNLRLEVKSSLNDNSIINCSSFNQLVSNVSIDTFLIHQLYVKENNHKSVSLLNLIKTIRRIIESDQKSLLIFDRKLEIFGIEKIETDLKLLRKNLLIYKITDDFPSLKECSIHNSITNIKYKIDLSMCSKWLTELKVNEL